MKDSTGESEVKNPTVSIPATITKITTMADKSIRLFVDTQELDSETKNRVFEMYDKLGYFFFAEEQIRKIDTSKLPEITLDEGEKSPSQRLRAAIFVFHEQQKIKEPFEVYYRRVMDKFIGQIKEKLT